MRLACAVLWHFVSCVGYSGVTRGYAGRRGSCPRPPRGVQQARGAKQPRLGKYFVTNEDNETAWWTKQKHVFRSQCNAVSVVVVLFRHLVIALCSILFFQDPCTSSTKRGHRSSEVRPSTNFYVFGGQFIACAAGRAPRYTQVTPLMR